jgi:ribosomal protein S18 acetylase RimI-like enzyme
MPSLDLRRYEPADRDAVWTVHDRAFRESPVRFRPEYDRYLRHVPATFLTPGGEFLVGTLPAAEAERRRCDPPGERVVATGGFRPVDDLDVGNDAGDPNSGNDADDPNSGQRLCRADGTDDGGTASTGDTAVEGGRTVELKSVRVDPSFQGRGYGRALVTELERRAREAGFDRAALSTSERLTAARALYRSLGYEEVRRDPRSDASSALVYLARSL